MSQNPRMLRVVDMCVDINRKSILNHATFSASPGHMLAVLGPSGSGKTTLLNAIAGRQPLSSGDITFGGQSLNKQLRRRLAYVLQSDVFLSNLTLWETLFFSAMIRLPEAMSSDDKMARVNEIIDALELRKCRDTVVGDMFRRGLSGGEKRRMNIACELLMDPDILLLDEPTSGLDSSTALTLMQLIQHYVISANKVAVVTIHQPSSQIYMLFESLLLLASGQVAYFGGGGEEPLLHFEKLGHLCHPNFNPADFLMDVLKSDDEVMSSLVTANLAKQSVVKNISCMRRVNSGDRMSEGLLSNGQMPHSGISTLWTNGKTDSTASILSMIPDAEKKWSRWPTGFWTQFRMLTWRNFKQSRGRILHLFDILHYAILSVLAGVMFFQISNSAEVFRDRMGLLFFCVTFWTFAAFMDAVLSFPGERQVVSKERSAGAYRLSAYYLAKTASELPLFIIAPTAFYTTIFWMAGLGDVITFFTSWPVHLLSVINAHGFGLLLGATFNDLHIAAVTGNTIVLIWLLLSGFITQSLPSWFAWARYLSIIQYSLSAMTSIVFRDMETVPCNTTKVLNIPQCISDPNGDVTSNDLLHAAGIVLPLYCYISTTFVTVVGFRIAAYLSLRYYNNPHLH